MTGPLVSAVIPAYNYGRYVAEAIESALAQTYRPVEVIVVDDGSSDDTRDRLEPYRDRIRYVYQENAGLSAARNTGIRHASGEWIALLDADDIWHPRKTEMQLSSVAMDAAIALIGSPTRSTASFGTLPERAPLVRLTLRHLLLSSRFGPSSALIRRRCLEAVGPFDVGLRSVEDRDMWLRIAARFPCAVVESPCWWYRTHGGQMSRNADRMLVNYRQVLEKFFREHPSERSLRRLAMSYMYFDAGWATFEEGRRLRAVWRLCRSAWCRPQGLGDPRTRRFARGKAALRAIFGRLPSRAAEVL